MAVTREQQKAEALARMKIMQMSDEVIFQFRENDKIFVSYLDVHHKLMDNDHLKKFIVVPLEPWLNAMTENDISRIKRRIAEFETEYGAFVYHVCIQGSSVILLYISQWQEEWVEDRWDISGPGYQVAYVTDLEDDISSNIRRVVLAPACGGVVRSE